MELGYSRTRNAIEERRDEIEQLAEEFGDVERAKETVSGASERLSREILGIERRIESAIATRGEITDRFESLTTQEQSRVAARRDSAFEKLKKISLETLNKEKEICNQNLRQIEKELLKQLRVEIAAEIPNCPTELREYFLQGELLLISMKHKSLLRETEQLMTALWTELTKVGTNPDDYLRKLINREN